MAAPPQRLGQPRGPDGNAAHADTGCVASHPGGTQPRAASDRGTFQSRSATSTGGREQHGTCRDRGPYPATFADSDARLGDDAVPERRYRARGSAVSDGGDAVSQWENRAGRATVPAGDDSMSEWCDGAGR